MDVGDTRYSLCRDKPMRTGIQFEAEINKTHCKELFRNGHGDFSRSIELRHPSGGQRYCTLRVLTSAMLLPTISNRSKHFVLASMRRIIPFFASMAVEALSKASNAN